MRRTVGLVLLGLGAFLVTAALLVALYVPGAMKKTPLDVDSKTRLSGQAATLPDGSSSPVKALSHTVANGELSDDDVVVFDSFTCLVKDDGSVEDCTDDGEAGSALITASTDSFAADRKTAMAVQDSKYVSEDSEHEGLVNKWPFDVKKETYPYWDGLLGRTIDAVFDGEEEIDGLNTYRFVTNVQDAPAQVAEGTAGNYTTQKTMWIDPVTGSIINQHEKQVRSIRGTPVLELDFGFTDETVAANVESAKSSGSQLGMLSTAPWILGLLGLIALGAGGFLAFAGGRPEDAAYADGTYADGDEPAYVDETQPVYEDRTDQFFEEAEADVETRRSRRDLE
ncbi:MAG: DUF3068 domain-containing protein [Actinomycetia bacterium]|nr:DUF3068 domain-containing protein [Actinomycetes bacterium]